MNDLVFLESTGLKMDAFTTADVVADYAGIQHKTVNRLIQQHEKDLAEFGLLRFKIEAVSRERGLKHKKAYLLNEQQATLLITYLKNTPPVRAFKKALVFAFFKAREELNRREVQREIKAPVRRSLTDAIRDSGENTRMMGFAYNTYTNLIYKSVTGYTARQLMDKRGAAKNAHAVDFLTSGELAEVTKREAQVCALLDLGMTYEQIRALLPRKEHRQ